jgi:hypothetical protein
MTEQAGEHGSRTGVVVLLTTWNRPALLGQSLPQIEREARAIGAPLVISDDQSDDPAALALLAPAPSRGIEVIRRSYVRRPNRRLEAAWKDEHFHIQWNNLFAFRHVLEHYPDAGMVLKVDDDVVLAPGAFGAMLSVSEKAARDGHDVLGVAGLATVYEPIVERFDGYAITASLCNAAVLYRRGDWARYVATIPEQVIVGYGFDVTFRDYYAPRHRAGARMISVVPSVVYHCGLHGTHEEASVGDININYVGDLGSVIVG